MSGKQGSPRISYLAVSTYHNDIFTYSPTFENYTESGILVPVAGGNSSKCRKGRILRENGRKLYPKANPGVTTYMVGVFDEVSGISGFIDPNSPVFTIYSTDKNYTIPLSTDPGVGGLFDQGMPILTNSTVEARLSVTAGTTVNAGTNVNAGIDINATRDVNAGRNVNAVNNVTVRNNVDISGNISVRQGRLILNSGNTGVVDMTSGTVTGQFKKLLVNASNCRTTSVVMLTYAGQNGPGFLSAEEISNGSFRIVSSNIADLCSVRYLIVN